VPVTALVQAAHHDQSTLDASIRESLQSFIRADWTFSSIRREGEAVGYERIRLTASARVSHAEIYNLKERARRAGREGLEIGEADVNYKLPSAKVNEANLALRLQILQDVEAQLPAIAQATGRQWRIGHIQFGARKDDADDNSTRFSKGGYRAASEEDVDLDSGLTGGESFSLLAEVTLRSVPAESSPST
jgi:hypothetical protein